jgi:hypothetical protein
LLGRDQQGGAAIGLISGHGQIGNSGQGVVFHDRFAMGIEEQQGKPGGGQIEVLFGQQGGERLEGRRLEGLH